MEDRFLLNPQDLISWCRQRKKALELSNQKLSDLSGVPIDTIDRVMSGNYTEFKYSSIQPIVSILLGFNQEVPEPNDKDKSQGEYYYETIEGYKLVLENKNQVLAEAKNEFDSLIAQLKLLKEENKNKQKLIDDLTSHIKWMEQHSI